MLEVSEIPYAASFETIAQNSPLTMTECNLVYQELQTTQASGDIKGLGGNYGGYSPDQGYESDPSSSISNWSSDETNQLAFTGCEMSMAETGGCTLDYSNDGNIVDLYTLEFEEITFEAATFTEALQSFTDPFLQDSTKPSENEPSERIFTLNNAANETRLSFSCSEDSGVYAPSSYESSSTDELEISDSEDVECEISYSPMPYHDRSNNEPKRRRKKRSSKQPILWEFLLDALNNPDIYSEMIHWVDKSEGKFEFTSSKKEQLAKKWGEAKRNRCVMTYQKMARALRNYINRGEVLQKVKKKLQYTFRPDFYRSIEDRIY